MTIKNNTKQPQLIRPTLLCDTRQAFESKRAMLLAIEPDRLLRVYLDVRKAVSAALAAAERMKPYSEKISRLYESEVDEVAELQIYARAAWHAEAVVTASDPDQLKVVADQGYEARSLLMSSARDLARRGLLPSSRVEQVSMSRSYDDLSTDLHGLWDLFDTVWDDIEGRTPVTRQEVEEALSLSERIGSQLVARQANLPEPGEPDAASMRQRAFTLLVEQHKRTRKAMAFILGTEQDLNAIVPPLARPYVYGTRRAVTPQVTLLGHPFPAWPSTMRVSCARTLSCRRPHCQPPGRVNEGCHTSPVLESSPRSTPHQLLRWPQRRLEREKACREGAVGDSCRSPAVCRALHSSRRASRFGRHHGSCRTAGGRLRGGGCGALAEMRTHETARG